MFGMAIETINEESRLLVPNEGQDEYKALFKYTFATEGLDGFVYFLYRIEGTPVSFVVN